MFEEESTGSSSMPEAIRPISNNSPSCPDAEEKKRRVHIDMNEMPKEDDNSDYSHEYERRGCEGEQEEGTLTKRKKLKLTVQQIAVLEKTFKEDSLLTKGEKFRLAEELNLTPRQVVVWFQNQRARIKTKKTEVDHEQYRRWCQALSAENQKLRNEVMELRALFQTRQAPWMDVVCMACKKNTFPSHNNE